MPHLRRPYDIRLLRYALASIGALTVDVVCFLALLTAISPTLAAIVAYSAGTLTHWLLTSRIAFVDTVVESGTGRTRQKAMFVLSALTGLAVTAIIVGAAESLSFDPRLAKSIAIVASFTVTWLLRSRVVFRGPAS